MSFGHYPTEPGWTRYAARLDYIVARLPHDRELDCEVSPGVQSDHFAIVVTVTLAAANICVQGRAQPRTRFDLRHATAVQISQFVISANELLSTALLVYRERRDAAMTDTQRKRALARAQQCFGRGVLKAPARTYLGSVGGNKTVNVGGCGDGSPRSGEW